MGIQTCRENQVKGENPGKKLKINNEHWNARMFSGTCSHYEDVICHYKTNKVKCHYILQVKAESNTEKTLSQVVGLLNP